MIKVFAFSLLAFAQLSPASIVVWTADGAVTSAAGNYFFMPDTPVSIRMTYDDEGGRVSPRNLRASGFDIVDYNYWNAIKLSIAVNIGGAVWSGSVDTADSSALKTLYLTVNNESDQQEGVLALIEDTNNGVFEDFPVKDPLANSSIQLQFSGDTTFLNDTITASELDVLAITSAMGSISSGDSSVGFSIDPASVIIANEAAVAPTPVITLVRTTSDNLAISWESVFDVNYRVQSSETLGDESWIDASGTFFGNGGTLTQNIAIIPNAHRFYRVLAVPADPL